MGQEEEEVTAGQVLGRGRRAVKPRRRFGEELETGDEQVEEDATPKKRGKGRPRKNPIEMVLVKTEKVDDPDNISEITDTSNVHTKRVTQDLDFIKDTIAALPSSSLLTLLEPIFDRLSPQQQVMKLDELLQLHLGIHKDSMSKQVPRDFVKMSLDAMERLAKDRVDNVSYYLNKALATNSLPVQSASFAILQVMVMSLFSNRLEDFFSQPQATVFSDWLETACQLFPAREFLDHLNSVLFPLTNMQFEQTTTADSDQMCIVLEILAQVEDAAAEAEHSAPEDNEETAVDLQQSEPEAIELQLVNKLDPHQQAMFEDNSGTELEAVGIVNPETGLMEPLEPVKHMEPKMHVHLSPKERKRRRITLPGEVPMKDGKAYCEECDIMFRENRNYFNHMEQHDGKKTHGCPFCERRFDLKRIAFNHVLENHCRNDESKEDEPTGFYCKWCNFESPEMSDSFKAHIRHHMTIKIQCEFCSRDFHAKSYLKEHIELQHKGPPYTCIYCEDVEFETKECFKHHMKAKHKPGLVCKVCGQQFKNRREQQEHFTEHTPEDLVAAGIKSKAVLNVIKDVIDQEKEQKKQEKAHKDQILKEQAKEVGLSSESESQSSSPQKRFTVRQMAVDPTISGVIDTSDPTCRLREKPHSCEYCGKSFTKPEVLKRHIARHMGADVEYKCRFCDEMLKSQKDARKHELDVHCKKSDGTYECQWCKKVFMNPVKLRSHEWLHTKPAEYQCQYCAHKCKSKSILQRHENTHIGLKPYQCPHCDKSFSLKHTLNEHILHHTGEKPFVCDHCENRRFVSKAQLKSHMMRIHQGMAKNFGCEVCGKFFTTKASLQIHVRIHTGERPFPCKVCGKGFSNMTAMKRHAMVMHSAGDGPHICPYCNKEFAYKYSMYYHRKLVHETEATLQCSYCEKKFRRRQEVQLHELVHTGVKAFKCRECGKQFRTKSQMLEHAIIHRGIPRFQCQSCDKAFLHRSSYKRHVLLHQGLLPYECPHCDKAFPDRSNMLSHVRHIHKEEATDPTMIPTPKVQHAPARLPRELRKYPKPRSFAATGTEGGQIEYEIVKSEPGMQINEAESTEISSDALRTLLEQSAAGENYLLNENGEYIHVLNYDENGDAVNVMAVEGETYNMEEIQQDAANIVDPEENPVDMQLLQEQPMMDGNEGSMVQVETDEGKQFVLVPPGTQFVQYGDQLLQIEGGDAQDANQVLQVQGGEIGDQILQIEGGEEIGEHVLQIEGGGDVQQ